MGRNANGPLFRPLPWAARMACGARPVKARAAYQDSCALWKAADPDIPGFIAAKSEYAKLR